MSHVITVDLKKSIGLDRKVHLPFHGVGVSFMERTLQKNISDPLNHFPSFQIEKETHHGQYIGFSFLRNNFGNISKVQIQHRS